MFAGKVIYKPFLSILVVLSGFLAACGPTTRPSDLATQQSALATPGMPTPVSTVAGTPVALPLVAKQGESSSASLPTQPTAIPAQAPAAEATQPLTFRCGLL